MYNPQITVERIRELRLNKGISLAELNEACGLNKNTITVSANSKTGLSAKILSDVSKFLGCSVDYLLGNDSSDSNISKTATSDNKCLIADSAISEITTIISGLSGASRYRAIADVLEVLEKYT